MNAAKELENGDIKNDNTIEVHFKKNSLHITPRDLLAAALIRDRNTDTSCNQVVKNNDPLHIDSEPNSSDHKSVKNCDGHGDNHGISSTSIDNISIDNILTSLEESCFIISDKLIEQKSKEEQGQIRQYDLELRKKKCCSYFALRYRQPEHSPNETKGESVPTNDLLKKFVSLSISTSTGTSAFAADKKNVSCDSDEVEHIKEPLLEIASRFVALRIMDGDGAAPISTNHGAKDANAARTNATAATAAIANGGGKLSTLFGISKTIYTKASTAVTSVLASYDLAEDPHLYNLDKNLYYDEDDYNDNHDDDALLMDDKHYSDNADFDQDDAKEYYLNESSNNFSPILFETDILWSVDLIIDCWSIIIYHANQSISALQANSNDFYEQLTTVIAREESVGSSKSVMNGIILNRTGDGKLSFLVFCHEAGLAATSYSSLEQLSLHHSICDVGRILENISLGTSLELLLLTLLETNNAIVSTNGGTIVLIPSSSPSYHSDVVKEKDSYAVNDVDIAAFKLSSTIQSLDRRINSLSDQSEALKKRALSSKQAGNTNIAIMHMKRRQILVNEIDRCSSSLLNLEAGLHSLKRAHSDVQILKAYDLMNSTMKLMREETSLSHVEEVMDEFHEGNEELQLVQESLGIPSSTHDPFCDIDDLEKELKALGEGNGGGDEPSNEGKVQKNSEGGVHHFQDEKGELNDYEQPTLFKSSSSSNTRDKTLF